MRLYLAHQLSTRHEIRKWELGFEKETGISLLNPFYDCPNRKDIKRMDKMKESEVKEYLKTRDSNQCTTIVERDLEMIRKCDGVVAFVTKSIGTSMEVIMASRIFNMPVFVITDKYCNHAWIKTHSNRQFKTKEDFEKWLRGD